MSNDGGVIARASEVNISCLFGIDGATVGLSGGPYGDGEACGGSTFDKTDGAKSVRRAISECCAGCSIPLSSRGT